MRQAERDRAIVKHLAEKVMGWEYPEYTLAHGGIQQWTWNPLYPSAATWEVWERAQRMGIYVALTPQGSPEDWCAHVLRTDIEVIADTGPRAICEAVYRATGGEELK